MRTPANSLTHWASLVCVITRLTGCIAVGSLEPRTSEGVILLIRYVKERGLRCPLVLPSYWGEADWLIKCLRLEWCASFGEPICNDNIYK
jgi:hypothetical protein